MAVKKINSLFLLCFFLVSSFLNAQTNFDIERASLFEKSILIPFEVKETTSLKKALVNGNITELDAILLVDSPDGKVALLTNQMAYNHVAQGVFNKKKWMASFCVVCNSAMGFSPVIDNKTYHFEGIGLYDGMIILKDKETGSLWNHITGECLYGKLKGTQLKSFNVLHTNVKRALKQYPNVTIAIADHSQFKNNPFYQQSIQGAKLFLPNNTTRGDKARLFPQFVKTLGEEDARLPRMSMGLGVWNKANYKFYPTNFIDEDIIIDHFGAKRIIIYNDPESFFPIALYTTANSFKKIREGVYELDNGLLLKEGTLTDKKGRQVKREKPLQMFSRWYGFSLTFPQTKIYSKHK